MTITAQNFEPVDGNPQGGTVEGIGLTVQWNAGRPFNDAGHPVPRNGAYIEDVIEAAKQRLEWYQDNTEPCDENATAIEALDAALAALTERGARIADEKSGEIKSKRKR